MAADSIRGARSLARLVLDRRVDSRRARESPFPFPTETNLASFFLPLASYHRSRSAVGKSRKCKHEIKDRFWILMAASGRGNKFTQPSCSFFSCLYLMRKLTCAASEQGQSRRCIDAPLHAALWVAYMASPVTLRLVRRTSAIAAHTTTKDPPF